MTGTITSPLVKTGHVWYRLVSPVTTWSQRVTSGDDVWFQLAVCRTVTFPMTLSDL